MNDLTFLAPASIPVPTADDDVRMEAYLAAESPSVKAEATLVSEQRVRVMIETPFAGSSATAIGLNRLYGNEALRDSLLRGEAPMAAHALYAQTFVLDQDDPDERELIEVARASWLPLVNRVIVYVDRGVTPSMEVGIRRARDLGVPVEERSISSWKRG